MSPTTRPGQARRAVILAAALDSFLEHGVAGASIEDVCARSGASVGSVYHHFGGKEGLAGAVFRAALGDYQRVFLAALRAYPDDAAGGIRAVVREHLRWCLADAPERALFLLLHGDAARGATGEAPGVAGIGRAPSSAPDGDTLVEQNREFFAEALAWLRRHVEHHPDLDLAYALWLGPAQEYCRLRLTGRTTSDPAQAAEVLADGAVRALFPTGPTESA